MLIDWFTVSAQVLNFLILVWLMKRFLYQPILHAVDERERRIAAQLSDAETKMADAENQCATFQQKNAAFELQREELLNQATIAAKAEQQRLVDEARRAAEAWSNKQRETLSSDARHLNAAISERTRQQVFAIVGKALTDLADTQLEARMVDVFLRQLQQINGQSKQHFAEALQTMPDSTLLRSAFELSAEQRAAIQKALNNTFSAEIPVRFETLSTVICGIELSANGWKLGWSIEEHIASMEKNVSELLAEQSKFQQGAGESSQHAKTDPDTPELSE